jgi:hypothetical protein
MRDQGDHFRGKKMKKYLKYIAGILFVVFIICLVFFIFIASYGCLGYFKGSQVSDVDIDLKERIGRVHHLTGEEAADHPALKELFINNKRVLKPTASLLDFIPGYFWGPEYADIRISVAEDRYLMDQGSLIFEYRGAYYQYAPSQC